MPTPSFLARLPYIVALFILHNTTQVNSLMHFFVHILYKTRMLIKNSVIIWLRNTKICQFVGHVDAEFVSMNDSLGSLENKKLSGRSSETLKSRWTLL